MKRIIARAILSGLAAGFCGIALNQGAQASTFYDLWQGTPGWHAITTVTITGPMMPDQPWLRRNRSKQVIEKPVVIQEKTSSRHLLNMGVDPIVDFSAL